MVQRRNEMFAEILKAVFIVILIVGVTMLYVILFGESEDRPV